MKFLVIFAAALLCVQAVRVPYILADSSEEEYHILLPPNRQGPVNLSGVGVVGQPVIQAVKVKVPRYANPLLKQHIIEQYLAIRGLSLQSFAGKEVDEASNVALEDLNARLDNFYNIGLGRQPRNAPHSGAKPIAAQKPIQQLQLISEASQEATTTIEFSSTSSLDTTIVPDVIETSTMTELPTVEGVTAMLDTTTPSVSSNDTPLSTNTPSTAPTGVPPTAPGTTITTITEPEPEPYIPLFGFGSLLPVPVSHPLFVPRIDPPSTATTTTAEEPVVVPQPGTSTDSILNRRTRAVPFNNRNHTQMTKVTPIPPVPQTEARGPKLSILSSSRKLRSVDAVAATPAQVVNSAAVGVQETTTQSKCDIVCTKFDFNPVCAFNGECYHQFANQCVMDTFVCKRPDLGFAATPRERCEMHWLKRCNVDALKSV